MVENCTCIRIAAAKDFQSLHSKIKKDIPSLHGHKNYNYGMFCIQEWIRRGRPSIVVLTKSDPSARGYASYQEPCHTMRAQPSPLERDRGSKFVSRAWETFPNGSVDWTTIFSWNEFWGSSPQNFDTSFAQLAYFVKSYESSIYVSSFSVHFLILSPFPLHFLILSPFSRSPAATSCATLCKYKMVDQWSNLDSKLEKEREACRTD